VALFCPVPCVTLADRVAQLRPIDSTRGAAGSRPRPRGCGHASGGFPRRALETVLAARGADSSGGTPSA
jgi:hypothetical protein